MIVTNKKRRGLPFLEFLFLLLSTTYYIHFKQQDKFALLAPFIAIAYICYVYFKEPSYRKQLRTMVLLIGLIAILYTLLNDASSISSTVSNSYLKRFYSKFSQYLMIFTPVLFLGRTLFYATQKQIYLIIGVALATSLVVSQAALTVIKINPLLVHSMNAETLEASDVSFTGFYFVYAFTFLVIFSLLCILYPAEKKWKYLSWILGLYSIYFLYKSQFTLSLVTSVISCYYLIIKFGKTPQFKLLSVLVGILTFFLLPALLNFITSISSSELLNERLAEMNVFFNNSGQANSDSDLHARLTLYGKAVAAFFNSPIWGNRYVDFDGHATFLMIWADLGIIGGIPISYMFVKAYKTVKAFMGNKGLYFAPFMVQIVLMGLTNPIHASIANFIMLWYICPLMIYLFCNKNK